MTCLQGSSFFAQGSVTSPNPSPSALIPVQFTLLTHKLIFTQENNPMVPNHAACVFGCFGDWPFVTHLNGPVRAKCHQADEITFSNSCLSEYFSMTNPLS